MSTGSTPAFSRGFPLDSVLGAGAGARLDLAGTTDMDVVTAIAKGAPMPARPTGVIELGRIGLQLSTGKDLSFQAGQLKVGVGFSAGVAAGVGIYDAPEKALAALELGEIPGLSLEIPDPAHTRFALLRAAYTASGAVQGTHPIGAIGSFSFGVSGKSAGLTAVLQAFNETKPAVRVLQDSASSWKLPRHVADAGSLAPNTWVIAEAEGTLAVKLAAQVGYDFSFVREVKAAGLAGDIGLKIDAAAKATFGFEVSGRYLVVVGRESAAETLRVRMFKLSRQGVEFGLNLKAGVGGIDSLTPSGVDDFVKAVFGVHGVQVVKALGRLDKWTDPSKSVGELVAGLANEKALELIKASTGIDPAVEFEKARARLVGAIRRWESLPDRVSSELLGLLDGIDPAASKTLLQALRLLGSGDAAVQKKALLDLLASHGFDQHPAGRILLAFADRGLLNLLDRLPEVRQVAGTVLDILELDVLRKLQRFITLKLDLDKVIQTVTKTDFKKLDSFLVGRLAAFLDREVDFEQIDEIRKTVHVVIAKRKEIYDKARKALTTRYGAEIAATWQKTTAQTALIDADFDTSESEGRRLLQLLLNDGDFDGVLTSTSKAATFRAAVLSHEVKRKSTVEVTLPKLSFRTAHANTSLASVSVEEEGGRLLLYQVDATDVVSDTRRRYRSALSLSLGAAAAPEGGSDLRIHGRKSATWSYQLQHARKGIQRGELEMYTRAFLERHMTERFGEGGVQWGKWYTELDQTVEGLLANGPNQFGDVLISMEVSIPGEALLAWLQPQTDVGAASKEISKAIQRGLKSIIPFYYFHDTGQLFRNGSAAALLVWSGIPPATSARLDGSKLALNRGDSVYWNYPDPELRRTMTLHPAVFVSLGRHCAAIRQRLEDLGLHKQAEFFHPDDIVEWIKAANSQNGDIFLRHLCRFEALVVEKAAEALRDMDQFLSLKEKSPSKAIDRLAEFGADITTAFHKLAGDTVYAKAPVRTLAQGVFLEATRAISEVSAAPRGMLTLTVLKPEAERQFRLDDFVKGGIPEPEEIAVEQRLVSAGG